MLCFILRNVGCADGNVRCTTKEGIPQPLGASCYYNLCINGVWSDVIPSNTTYSCIENELVLSDVCNPTPPELPQCDFSGIRCLADEDILVSNICTSRYLECEDNMLSSPRSVACECTYSL